jgi:DNA-binding CsgD family transcriptional regulator
MLRLSPEEKAEIRRLAASGMPSRQIGRVIGRADRTVGDYIDRMKQRPPRVRTRASVQLTLAEREEISRGLAEGHSIRSIASGMSRSPSMVCREVARNGGRRRYRAVRAEDRAWVSGRRPKVSTLAGDPVLRAVVEEKLGLQWSPQQISGWLRWAVSGGQRNACSRTCDGVRRERHQALRRGPVARVGVPNGESRRHSPLHRKRDEALPRLGLLMTAGSPQMGEAIGWTGGLPQVGRGYATGRHAWLRSPGRSSAPVHGRTALHHIDRRERDETDGQEAPAGREVQGTPRSR